MKNVLLSAGLALSLAACATTERELPQGVAATGDTPRVVHAAGVTLAGPGIAPNRLVDADDPALWADPSNPTRGLIFGTDKTNGLYVHDLDGTQRGYFGDGPLNNVDLRPGFRVNGKEYVLVAATERERFGIMTWLLDPATLEVMRYGFVPTDFGEPYGFCMGKRGADFFLVANNKEGEVRSYRVTAGADGPMATLARTMRVGSQPEGCVVDDSADRLYVGEEDVGSGRFSFDPAGTDAAVSVAAIDNQRLTADVEGLALLRDRGATYLIASSQGDSTYPVWRVEGDSHTYVGRFTIAGGAQPMVRSTDGVDAWSGPIGRYPEGLIAVHNQAGQPTGNQNYVLVDWRDVKRALSLP